MADSHSEHHEAGHVVPPKLLFGVGGFLLVMTGVTVFTATQIDLGSLNIWIALLIAFVKASAVCLYFMHLRWDSPFNAIVLISALLFVILFIGFALTDSSEYQPLVNEFEYAQPLIPPYDS